ncbi:MAG: DUF4173 domain-containing protein [Chthoniobacteraceae bacterium]
MSAAWTGSVENVASGERTLAAAACIATTLLAGDSLLRGAKPGLSLGVFVVLLGCLLLIRGRRSRGSYLVAALLLVTAFQLAVEICFTGLVVTGGLIIVLFAETTFFTVPRGAGRWLEATWAVVVSPGRWFSFGHVLMTEHRVVSGIELATPARLGKVAHIVLPAAALVVVFGMLLSFGNAIFGELTSRMSQQAVNWLLHFDWSPTRVLLWMAWFGLGIALFWPPMPALTGRWWTRPLDRWTRSDSSVAFWQSALALIAVNALFFAANTIDAVYLWEQTTPPAGVNASAFVHEGVQSLIGAVMLSAVVLTAIFHQSAPVSESRLLRGLALFWMAQNIALIGSVLLRLKFYVEAWQLSELRAYVACFLALVTVGFLLLARHVWRGLEIGKLVRENLAATFMLFFILQFPDVGRVVANYNVKHWLDHPERNLDRTYLESLGASGWPALLDVANSNRRPEAAEAAAALRRTAAAEKIRLASLNWRGTQWRRDSAARLLIKGSRNE